MLTFISLYLFPFVNQLVPGDFFGVGLEVCPLILVVHIAHSVLMLMGSPFPIADPAPTMLPPVLGKAQKGISNSQRLLSLTRWCVPPLGLVKTIRFRVVGQGRKEVCILMIFPGHVLPAGRRLSILRPWKLTVIFAYGWIFFESTILPIVAALVIPMTVTVLNASLVFGIKLQFHGHGLDY